MSRGKRNRDNHHAAAEQNGSDTATVPDTGDVFDEAIAAAQDRMEQAGPPSEPAPAEQRHTEQHQAEPGANGHHEANGNGYAPEVNGHQADGAAPEANGHAAEPARKSKWVNNFHMDTHEDVEVKLTEDRRNHLMTISFAERPSERSLDELAAAGFKPDPELRDTYSKRINHIRPGDTRDQAKAVTFAVANHEREAKGLPVLTDEFVPGRSAVR